MGKFTCGHTVPSTVEVRVLRDFDNKLICLKYLLARLHCIGWSKPERAQGPACEMACGLFSFEVVFGAEEHKVPRLALAAEVRRRAALDMRMFGRNRNVLSSATTMLLLRNCVAGGAPGGILPGRENRRVSEGRATGLPVHRMTVCRGSPHRRWRPVPAA
jgi:hypothetical protein